ncbi:hypothetical protein SMD44_07553 [Streptomyces alboflavus]|uniref:Uncharacterized protein n=1 Tax=Streptomyces alboflavus TaxID=67267 RepID=A0A1Z1WNQ5_9ACTN|nr:hypothetical protein SMD44_07553 [Streptomyces alboflavus]
MGLREERKHSRGERGAQRQARLAHPHRESAPGRVEPGRHRLAATGLDGAVARADDQQHAEQGDIAGRGAPHAEGHGHDAGPDADDPAFVVAVEQLTGHQQADQWDQLGRGDQHAELGGVEVEVALQGDAEGADALHEEAGGGLREGGDAEDGPPVAPWIPLPRGWTFPSRGRIPVARGRALALALALALRT